MLLKLLVLIGLAVYFGVYGQWVLCITSLLCFIPIYGLYMAILLAIILLISPFKIAGGILSLFIVFTLFGNKILQKSRRSEYIYTSDITLNFIRYCREYLITLRNFYENDADLAILDPHLGSMMDEIKGKWSMDIAQAGEDPDIYLVNFKFDSYKMTKVNKSLDKYAKEYKSRKEEIKKYLRDIGHPLGGE